MADEELRNLERRALHDDEARQRLDRLKTRLGVENKIYIVSEVHWEYNDNWYYQHEHAGAPIEAFRDKITAQKACDTKNITHARSLTGKQYKLGDHFYGTRIAEYFEERFVEIDDALAKRLNYPNSETNTHGDQYAYVFPEDATDEDILQFLKETDLHFFVVSEIDYFG